ncbi:hypothetical protein [Rhizobium phaseoli]|uniref:hypothetical protein n=1 Tax=Rhizobium phaseoli TaxID=396 RepID=UPI0007EA9A40|nr:hypothetical protein [Rhizobium phaseoli]
MFSKTLDQTPLPALFKIWVDKQPDEKALQHAEEQNSDGKAPMEFTGKDKADSDDQENRDNVRYDFHLLPIRFTLL